ncbi:hypothetical protein HY933_00495, partial [Candidatus Falkowbacteria bacterium]|nr:hypothetical protein [Candidatus Falkowbacteria bacterium]
EAVNACEHAGDPCDSDEVCNEQTNFCDLDSTTSGCSVERVGNDVYIECDADANLGSALLGCDDNPDEWCDLSQVPLNLLDIQDGRALWHVAVLEGYDSLRIKMMGLGFFYAGACDYSGTVRWFEDVWGGFIDLTPDEFYCLADFGWQADPLIGAVGYPSQFSPLIERQPDALCDWLETAGDYAFSWTFTDGDPSSGLNPDEVVTFDSPGEKLVELRLYQRNGAMWDLYETVAGLYEVRNAVPCDVDADCNDNDGCTFGDECGSDGFCGWGINPCQDDGFFCNGDEVCVSLSDTAYECGSAGDPCSQDGLYCNGDERCDEDLNSCYSDGDPCLDGEECEESTDECLVPQCQVDADCDDGLYCNGSEFCFLGSCAPAADGPCSQDETCDEGTDSCVPNVECQVDADCDDGLFCNGTETCESGFCANGAEPCTQDETCDELTDTCTGVTPPVCGDFLCETPETVATCPVDCAECAVIRTGSGRNGGTIAVRGLTGMSVPLNQFVFGCLVAPYCGAPTGVPTVYDGATDTYTAAIPDGRDWANFFADSQGTWGDIASTETCYYSGDVAYDDAGGGDRPFWDLTPTP